MPTETRTLSAEVDGSILDQVQSIATTEGRQIEALVEEALSDLVEKRRGSGVRPHVMEHFKTSLERYDLLYRRLSE